MSLYKIKCGNEPGGSYWDLYKKFLFLWIPVCFCDISHRNGYMDKMREWQRAYNIPDNRVILKH